MAGFLVFAVAFQLERWKGYNPFIFLDSDAGQIVEFAAAWDNPEAFTGDALLGDVRRFRFYTTIHIPLIILLGKLTGSYGTGMVLLLGVHVFLMLTGFYVLGRTLFGSRFWGLVLAVLIFPEVSVYEKEIWGVMWDPLPGFTFQALSPFLLAAAYRRRGRPSTWPWLMLAAGLLVYFHPVSAPSWCVGLWLGFAVAAPRDWTLLRRVWTQFKLGLPVVLAAAPFAIWYLAYHDTGTADPAQSALVQKALADRLTPYDLSVVAALGSFVRWFNGPFFPQGYLALAGAVGMIVWRRGDRRSVLMVVAWYAGVLAFSIGVPGLSAFLSWLLDRSVPLQIDLFRPVKYIVPFTAIFVIWPLAEGWRRVDSRAPRGALAQAGLVALGLAVGVFWTSTHWYSFDYVLPTVKAWLAGRVMSDQSINAPRHIEAVRAVAAHTPTGARIMAASYPLAVRYTALRPVVYCFKDGGPLSYSDSAGLLAWHDTYKRLGHMEARPITAQSWPRVLGEARALGAEYLFMEVSVLGAVDEQGQGLTAVWKNGLYSLWRLKPPASSGPAGAPTGGGGR